ncbi:hypothetical protein ACFQAV_08170 [Companilactobacillus huachuanensis]|uniref:Immunity protein n=1 Tax=Companilactobacillus huachuanensis TaxID=2559914 RepID=A0ABW1RL82_9LACO|nr:hypothetical protein [Companilactobacillus huachuanensis]
MIWNYVFGILAVSFGMYQMFNSIKYVKVIQHNGNKTTSNFSALTVWYSLLFGLFFIIGGVVLFVIKSPLF